MLPAYRCGSFTQPGTAFRASSFYVKEPAKSFARVVRLPYSFGLLLVRLPVCVYVAPPVPVA